MADIHLVFKSVSSVLLKREVGKMDELQDYLTKYTVPMKVAKSESGKDIYYTAPYQKDAKFISFGNTNPTPKINMNDIRDIDGIISACSETIAYSGNKVLGNCQHIEESENITDSSTVYRSSEILRCEYIAYSSLFRDSKYLFGCCHGGDNEFCIRCDGINQSQRCFESSVLFHCFDTYYSNNCKNCHDVFFCFDQQQKSYMIGNNELAKDRYLELKGQLLEQITDELIRKKTVPSLVDFFIDGFRVVG